MIKKKSIFKMLLLSLFLAMAMPGIYGNSMNTVNAKTALNKKKVSIKYGKTATLKVKDAKKRVKWSTSNASIVKIKKTSGSKKQNAVVQGVGKGRAVITAKIGAKKLKATVNVKHTHSYTYPATCTSPAKCRCGATYGPALGHAWAGATCQTAARCSRCGAVGSKAAHVLDTQGYCMTEGCVKHDVLFWLDDEELGTRAGCVWLNLVNSGRQTLQIGDDASQGKGTLFLDDVSGAGRTVYLVNRNTGKYDNFMYANPGIKGMIQFHNGEDSLISGSAHLQFYFWYGNKRYYANVTRDVRNWTYIEVN